MLKYSDLTQKQKDFLSNGCGAKGGIINPPDFIFKASCGHHDFRFWIGCSWKHFFKANKDFYKWMRVDIKEANIRWYKKAYYHTWAFSYFSAVNIFGVCCFNFSDRQRTLEDLIKLMESEK